MSLTISRMRAASSRFYRASARRCLQQLTMPALSPTMTEGALVNWKVPEGKPFSEGDVLFEVETDKAQLDVDAQESGILAKIVVPAGSKGVQVNSVIAVVAEADESYTEADIKKVMGNASTATQSTPSPTSTSSNSAPQPLIGQPATTTVRSSSDVSSAHSSSPSVASGANRPLSPAVAHLASLYQLEVERIAKIPHTGPQGRLLKGDVLAFVRQQGLAARQVVHPEPSTPSQVSPTSTSTQESTIRSQEKVQREELCVPVPEGCRLTAKQLLQALRHMPRRTLARSTSPLVVSINGVSIVVGEPAASVAALGSGRTVPIQVTVDGVQQVPKPSAPFRVTTMAQELAFYDYLDGSSPRQRKSPSPSPAAPKQPFAKSVSNARGRSPTGGLDLFDYLGDIPSPRDKRFHLIQRFQMEAPSTVPPAHLRILAQAIREVVAQTTTARS